ncbi:hypothetical protein ThimaDRAFT_4454 [Thiocapsa marina 5811]|uniref:Uncharacterized protein n=1 Tax=Thiocapsa marina 5811 TaxID=768671 RepID=F9UHQ1_9GAMM|nr:hypothetical protein ThimaDRAFT_4454 [Thiocapsa marina 5811]
MARLGDRDDLGISLFPMFNILIATLGVLVFIMSALATLSLSSGNVVIDAMVCGTGDISCNVNKKIPTYLEWDGARLVLHPSKSEVRIHRSLSSIRNWEETYRYLDRSIQDSELEREIKEIVKDSESRYFVILVRPEGFESFSNLQAYFSSHLNLDLGYEPLLKEWKTIQVREHND